MSSRQLRKIQKQRELEEAKLQQQNGGAEPESEEVEDDYKPQVKPSLFANLAALQNDDEDGDLEDSEKEENDSVPKADEKIEDLSVSPAKKSKKSKKKKKPKLKPQENEDVKTSTPASNDGMDEIDAALKELNFKNTKGVTELDPVTVVRDPAYERICSLLSVHTQHLKVANEMRNLFGRSAIENHDDAGGAVPRAARRRQRAAQQQVDLETALKGQHAPGKGLPEVTLRRNIFVQGKDEWPRATTGGLSMEVVDDQRAADGTVEFRFVHDKAYNEVQEQFKAFVEMGNPQNLIVWLQRNPYNISLLLQVSKIAKDQSDHALSSDLVERALFTFGRASTSLFATKLSEGKARLDFARPENRELWLAGYQYIKSLVMKGTYRTAFEWAKLLLSLDPEGDPYCMVLMIHHLALRAHEFQYVLDLANAWALLSRAIGSHTTPSLALAAMHLKDGAKCRSLLGKYMQELPWLFCKLFQELNLDNLPPSIWGAVPRTDAENLFTEIYVRQTKDIWNTPEATSLLMEVAHAIDKLKEEEIPRIDNSKISLDVARFVYLDGNPAVMAYVPSHILHRTPNSDSDPLPPDYNIFSWPSQARDFANNEEPGFVRDAFANMYHPIEALRNAIPGFTGEGGAADQQALEETGFRGFLERIMATEREEDVATEGTREGTEGAGVDDNSQTGQHQPPSSGIRAFYEYLFGGSRSSAEASQAHRDSGSTTSDDEDLGH